MKRTARARQRIELPAPEPEVRAAMRGRARLELPEPDPEVRSAMRRRVKLELPEPDPEVRSAMCQRGRLVLPPPDADVRRALRRQTRLVLPDPDADVCAAMSPAPAAVYKPSPWERTQFEFWTIKYVSQNFVSGPAVSTQDVIQDCYIKYRKLVDKYVTGAQTIQSDAQLMAAYTRSVRNMLCDLARKEKRRTRLAEINLRTPELELYAY